MVTNPLALLLYETMTGHPFGETVVITSMPEFEQRFRDSFPDMGSGMPFVDVPLSVASRRPRLDVTTLDAALVAKHGVYSGALSDCIQTRYGVRAVQFVKEAL